MKMFEDLPRTLTQIEKESGTITLKAVYKNAGAFTVCPVKDPNRPGFYLGVERLSDEEKRKRDYWVDPEKLSLKITDGREFDLSKIVDKLNWEWVKHIPEVVMSFEEAQESSYEIRCYVQIEEMESQKTVSRMNLKLQALNLINQDEPSNYVSRARLLGMDMRGQKLINQKEFLMTLADRDPTKVIAAYHGDTVGVRILMLNAIDKNIIDLENGIYSYNAKTLGMSEDAVVDALTRNVNKSILELIQQDLDYITSPEKDNKTTEEPELAEATEAPTSAPRPRGGN